MSCTFRGSNARVLLHVPANCKRTRLDSSLLLLSAVWDLQSFSGLSSKQGSVLDLARGKLCIEVRKRFQTLPKIGMIYSRPR